MEDETRFNLNQALAQWRHGLEGKLTREDLRELEAHLRDHAATLREQGLSDAESFAVASRQIGESKNLLIEYSKIMKTGRYPLMLVSWTLYAISFFLPSYHSWSGLQCAFMQGVFWQQALHGPSQWLSVHYELLTLANMVMLASPFMSGALSGKKAGWLRGLAFGSMILTWAFIATLWLRGNGNDIQIGCYLWATSFAILWISRIPNLEKHRTPKFA